MLSSLLATLAMLLLAFQAKLLTRDWCHPAVVFCLLWGVSSSLAMLLAPEGMASPTGPLWILLNAALVVAGGVMGTALATPSARSDGAEELAASRFPSEGRRSEGRRCEQQSRSRSAEWDQSERRLKSHTKASILLGLVFVPLCLRSQGISAGQLTSPAGIVKTAAQMTVKRYTHTEMAIPGYVQVFLAFSYVAPLLGGTLFVRRRRASDLGLSLATLLPCIAGFAVQSTKASVLYGITMWLAGCLVSRVYVGRRALGLRVNVLAPTLLAVPLVILFLMAGEALRGGRINLPRGGTLLTGRMKTQLVGHLPALSQWIDTHELGSIVPSPGRHTLAGLYRYANANGRVYYESVFVATGVTNVYTYFRDLVEDYTWPGALMLIFFFAAFAGFAYGEVLARKAALKGGLAACYAATIYVINSIFSYNSMLLALLIYALWTLREGRLERRDPSHSRFQGLPSPIKCLPPGALP